MKRGYYYQSEDIQKKLLWINLYQEFENFDKMDKSSKKNVI